MTQADKISGFLKEQKTRTTAASAKSEWLLVHASLQEERDACEKELHAVLLPLAENLHSGLHELSTDALATLHASAEECSSARLELREQLKSLSRSVQGVRACSPSPASLTALESQLKILEEDLALQVMQLKEEGEVIEAEIRELQRTEEGEESSSMVDEVGCLIDLILAFTRSDRDPLVSVARRVHEVHFTIPSSIRRYQVLNL